MREHSQKFKEAMAVLAKKYPHQTPAAIFHLAKEENPRLLYGSAWTGEAEERQQKKEAFQIAELQHERRILKRQLAALEKSVSEKLQKEPLSKRKSNWESQDIKPTTRLRAMRQKAGLSQMDLAITSDVSITTLNRLEVYPALSPSYIIAGKLAQALGCRLCDLWDDWNIRPATQGRKVTNCLG